MKLARAQREPLEQVKMLQGHPARVIELLTHKQAPDLLIFGCLLAVIARRCAEAVHHRIVCQAGLVIQHFFYFIRLQLSHQPRWQLWLRPSGRAASAAHPWSNALLPWLEVLARRTGGFLDRELILIAHGFTSCGFWSWMDLICIKIY